MKLHHLRNATFVIESGESYIVIDPMLSDKGKLPPFAWFRHKPERNPIVSLPDNASQILDKVTHCLITHSQTFGIKALQHTDHLDTTGESFLKNKNIPVVCREQDAAYPSTSGPRGGYTITTELNDITLLDLVEAVEGPIDMSTCLHLGPRHQQNESCALHRPWTKAREALIAELAHVTIDEIACEPQHL